MSVSVLCLILFFFQAEDGIRDTSVTGVQTCALPISIDADRIYLAGQSMGGLGVWALLEVQPDRWAAALVLCAFDNLDRKSTRLNSSHRCISYAVFCLKKKKKKYNDILNTHAQNTIPT